MQRFLPTKGRKILKIWSFDEKLNETMLFYVIEVEFSCCTGVFLEFEMFHCEDCMFPMIQEIV